MYIIARMILGFGIVFCIVNGSAMLGELAYPKERPIMTSIFNSSWFVGSLIASGIVSATICLTTARIDLIRSFRQFHSPPSLLTGDGEFRQYYNAAHH